MTKYRKYILWYMRWRTTIWSTIFFVVGLFGGNIDRIIEKIPTLKYRTPTIEEMQKFETVPLEKIEKIQNLA